MMTDSILDRHLPRNQDLLEAPGVGLGLVMAVAVAC